MDVEPQPGLPSAQHPAQVPDESDERKCPKTGRTRAFHGRRPSVFSRQLLPRSSDFLVWKVALSAMVVELIVGRLVFECRRGLFRWLYQCAGAANVSPRLTIFRCLDTFYGATTHNR